MPSKVVNKKYRKLPIELKYNADTKAWAWTITYSKPFIWVGDASSLSKALTAAKRRIDSIQDET